MKIVILCICLVSTSLFASLKSDFIQSKTKNYTAISLEEFDIGIKLFSLLFAQKNIPLQNKYLKILKLSVHKYQNTLVILDTDQRGWGFYIIKHNIKKGSLLSIPHRFYDIGTAQIAKKMFLKFPYKAIAFNTVSRKVMDTAHSKYTLFDAFHLAFVRLFPKQNSYQLHGFTPKTRDSYKAKIAQAIVSSTHIPSTTSKNIVSCMQGFQDHVMLYGEDVFELGGTSNAQGRLLKQEGYRYFTHIELSQTFRKNLKKDALLRKHLYKCLP